MNNKLIDLTGQTFHELLVLGPAERRGYWRTQCSCGVTKEILGASMRSGNTQSCGHLRSNSGRRKYLQSHVKHLQPAILETEMASDPEVANALTILRNYLKARGVHVGQGVVRAAGLNYRPEQITNSRIRALGYALANGVTTSPLKLSMANRARSDPTYGALVAAAGAHPVINEEVMQRAREEQAERQRKQEEEASKLQDNLAAMLGREAVEQLSRQREKTRSSWDALEGDE